MTIFDTNIGQNVQNIFVLKLISVVVDHLYKKVWGHLLERGRLLE